MILVDIKHFLFPLGRKKETMEVRVRAEVPNLLILVVLDSCKS